MGQMEEALYLMSDSLHEGSDSYSDILTKIFVAFGQICLNF
jgi:hypothetical protein